MRKLFAVTMVLLLMLTSAPTGVRPAASISPTLKEAKEIRTSPVESPGKPVTAAPPESLSTLSTDRRFVAEAAASHLGDFSAPSAVQANAENIEFVGHIGGTTKAVFVQGDYAYIGEGPRLTILDISNPASPSVVGKTFPFPDIVRDVYVSGDYAYVANDFFGGLRVVDISNPFAPTEVGFYDTPGWAEGVAVAGDYAYVTEGYGGLRVVDVSNPSNPTEVGSYDTLGAVHDVAVAPAGDYVYIAGYDLGLRVVDVSDPSSPSEVGFYDTPGWAKGVAIAPAGDYAYIADGWEGGLRVVDVSTPSSPSGGGFYNTLGNAYGVAVALAGDYAYVADYGEGLRVVDISNPSSPTEVGFCDTQGHAEDVAVVPAGDYAFVAAGDGGLRAVDVSTPSSPSEIGFYDTMGAAQGVAVAGDYAYVADDYYGGLRVVNISNPSSPSEVGFYDTPGSALDVAVAPTGNYAYVADWWDGGLRVIDISIPSSPSEVGFYDTPGAAWGVAVAPAGDYVYIADYASGLGVIDVSNPSSPSVVGSYHTPGGAWDVAVAPAGDYAYVAARWEGGLRVVDISIPSNPSEAGFYDTPGDTWDVAIAPAGDYAYVADSEAGLRVVDVSNPSSPSEVGFYDTLGAYGVEVAPVGDYVYVYSYIVDADWSILEVVDVSDPSNPAGVGFCYTPGYVQSVAVAPAGDYAYVADDDGGLIILRYTGGEAAYSISGHVQDGSGDPISGVTVSVGAGGSATTDASGTYTITGLVTGTYTITPAKTDWTFEPPTRTVSVPPDATGQDFTAILVLQDIGFLPNPDGYGFSNSDDAWGTFPWSAHDFRYEDLVRMFGQDAVCWMVSTVCFVKPTADWWHVQANLVMNRGHCDGIASTSLRFFKGLDNPADFQTGANTTHDLQLGNARRHVAYYFVEQFTDPVRAYKEQVRQNTPSVILDQLRSAMSVGAPDPTTLFVRQADQGGHAITPYAIEDRGDRVYWVRVYDNNHRDDANRYVVINKNNDTWSYDLGWTTWYGDADTHTLGIVPISKYAEQPVCPSWCNDTDTVRTSNGSSSGQIWLTGDGHLLMTDAQGRRIGYVDDQFVNEIPGAYESIVDGGLGIEVEPIYTLPFSDTYTILLDGQTLTQTETVAVTQFGPGYAAWMDDVALGPTSQDRLTVAPAGTQLTYQPSGDREATLTLALDGASESNQLQVKGADIGAGQVVTLTVEIDDGQLKFNNAKASGGEYVLDVRRVSPAGEQWFVHAGLVISATDTHYVDYGAWDGSGAMTLDVDHGSDGTIDETLELENQTGHIYLPLIARNYTPLQADFTASPTSGAAPLTVTFTNTSIGVYTTSLWNFGDSVTSTLENPTHIYTAVGTYTVTLTVGGPDGTDTLTRVNYIIVSELSCDDAISNGGFEYDTDWELPVIGGYTTTVAHDGGRSMLLGIIDPADNVYTYASAQQEVTVPAEASDVTLRYWLYPLSEELGTPPWPAELARTLEDAMLWGDVQYVIIRNQYDEWIDTLLWQRSDDQAWTFHEFDLTAYAGQTIKLNFGVYNDGHDGVTAAYLDDVSLEICYPLPQAVVQ